jgi:hypothetical protein
VDLRRDLRAIWLGGSTQHAGAIKSLLTHIGCCAEDLNLDASRRRSSSGTQSRS